MDHQKGKEQIINQLKALFQIKRHLKTQESICNPFESDTSEFSGGSNDDKEWFPDQSASDSSDALEEHCDNEKSSNGTSAKETQLQSNRSDWLHDTSKLLPKTSNICKESIQTPQIDKIKSSKTPLTLVNDSDTSENSIGSMEYPALQASSQCTEYPSTSDQARSNFESGERNVSVKRSKKLNLKRVSDKGAFSTFCFVISTNLSKHLLSKHSCEAEIQKIMSLPKGCKDRLYLIEKLRNLGNYQNNCKVLKEGNGVIIPYRCPAEDANVSSNDYGPCNFCLGLFL